MNIEPEKIQEAKERLGDRNADIIVDLLHPEQYDSRRRVCCCMWPDHDDNHPSMSYNPKTYSFHCFSCGRGDIDIIQAYMMAQGCTFIEACKQLFEAADMPYDFGEQGVHTLGRKYQYPKPKYSKTKDRVYDYWSKRCISPATIDYGYPYCGQRDKAASESSPLGVNITYTNGSATEGVTTCR